MFISDIFSKLFFIKSYGGIHFLDVVERKQEAQAISLIDHLRNVLINCFSIIFHFGKTFSSKGAKLSGKKIKSEFPANMRIYTSKLQSFTKFS